MTGWYPPEIKPVRAGEYNASVVRDPKLRRHWNGRRWSSAYHANATDYEREVARKKPASAGLGRALSWRGLAEDPRAKVVE